MVALGSVPGTDTAAVLSVADLSFPTALAQVGALIIRGDTLVASLTAPGSVNVAAAVAADAGVDYLVYGYATAASGSAGSYSVDVKPSAGPALLHATSAVTDPTAAIQAYVFPTTVTTAGSYTVDFTDFQFPAPLTHASLAAAQSGALVGSPIAAGATLTGSLVTGPLDVIVTATPATAGGLFGLDVEPAAGGAAVLAASQGVGGAFSLTPVAITSAGNYIVTATDIGFPAAFAQLAVVVTQGTQNLGSIIGSGGTGKLTFAATPGTYFVNFIATPNATSQAGTFALSVAQAPPAPSVTLSSSALAVANGSTVTLTWTSQNATSCNASGGWSGALATSGSQKSPTIDAAATFTLTCTGAGGSTAQSVTVSLTPASSGGGALDPALLAGLLIALATRPVTRWSRGRLTVLRRGRCIQSGGGC
jgi:hypothetical protein